MEEANLYDTGQNNRAIEGQDRGVGRRGEGGMKWQDIEGIRNKEGNDK
jgi:hypothetical protein